MYRHREHKAAEARELLELPRPQIPVIPEGREVINLALWRVYEPGNYKSLAWIFVVVLVSLFGSILFFSGFCHELDYTFDVVNLGNFNYDKCGPQDQERDNFLTPGTRVVFMVIDAWRYDFLTSAHSPMKFVRKSVENGRAVMFKGIVQPPTVTMPRIKAMTSGVIPSFTQAVYNFFTSESTIDSWVKQAFDHKKKIVFYGDDTWVKLFPLYFSEFEGVPSFNVKDYTNVDNIVTENMRRQLNSTSWDLMILHYLGLDHIGHSLGAKSSKIKPKLAEMDSIVEEMYKKLSKEGPLTMVVLGDHGMNDLGAHGGSSREEIEVPIVIFHNRAKVVNSMKIGKVDIATTMAEFLRVPLPERTRGVSLLPLLQKYWYMQYQTLLHSNIRLCLQLSRYVKHAPSVERFLSAEVGDDRKSICTIGDSLVYPTADTIKSWSRELQNRILKSVDETWEVASYTGLILVGAMGPLMVFNDFKHVHAIGFKYVVSVYHVIEWFLIFTPVISIFSSSLVEEEHDMWNYYTCVVIVIRAFQVVQHALWLPLIDFGMNIREDTELTREKRRKRAYRIIWNACIMLFCHRFAVAFGASSRRRWKMDAELMPKPIYNDPDFMKNLYWLTRRTDPQYFFGKILPGTSVIFAGVYLTSMCNKYLKSKYRGSFPFQSIVPFYTLVLITKGLAITCGIEDKALAIITPISLLITVLTFWLSPSISIIFYLLYLCKPEQQILLILAYELGSRAKLIYIDRYFFCIMFYTTFFYSGTSNKLESIDVNAGYYGISEYNVIVVGFQIFMNTYAPCIVFLFSYVFYTSAEYNVLVSPLQQEVAKVRGREAHVDFFYIVHFRILLAGTAIIAMQFFSGHLFVWTVFAPKALFEVFHCAIVLFVSSLFTLPAFCADYTV
ncbi:unnamed protein product [Auanema sp. JU1783]|nr:unnamed protein product [Auanema sp. JU1783]